MNALSRMIPTEDGRELHIIQAGPIDGVPVLVHHGTPGSGGLYPAWIADAESRGIRLIGYDRPGYGDSTPAPGRTVSSAASDVAAIAQELNLERLLVWGVSGGGPHALACAALLPDLVVATAALASPAPYPADDFDWFAGMGEDNLAEFGAALAGREALVQFVEAAAAGLLEAEPAMLAQALRSLLSPADVAVFTDEYANYLYNRIEAGIRKSRAGWIDDDLAFTRPWGFDLSQIRNPVLLVQGEQDLMVPFAHARWLAGKIPGVEYRFLADDGHLTLSARRIPEVHTWLLSKL